MTNMNYVEYTSLWFPLCFRKESCSSVSLSFPKYHIIAKAASSPLCAIVIFSFPQENTPLVFVPYLYLAETHINTSVLWSDVSSEIDIIISFCFWNCSYKNGTNASGLFLVGKNGPTDGYKKAQLEADWILSDSP